MDVIIRFHEGNVLALGLGAGYPQVVTGVGATEVVVQWPVLPVFQIGSDGLSSTHSPLTEDAHAFNRFAKGTAGGTPCPGAMKSVQEIGLGNAAELPGTIRAFIANTFKLIGLDIGECRVLW